MKKLTIKTISIGIPVVSTMVSIVLWQLGKGNLAWSDLTAFAGSFAGGIATMLAVCFNIWKMDEERAISEKLREEDYECHKAELAKADMNYRTNLASERAHQEALRLDEKRQAIAEKVAVAVADFCVDISRYYDAGHNEAFAKEMGSPNRMASFKNFILLKTYLSRDPSGLALLASIEDLYHFSVGVEYQPNEFSKRCEKIEELVQAYCADKLSVGER